MKMQRVLSFEMARGVNESSLYVTKRLCFSLVFSISFLSLLFGFFMGRLATQRNIDYRAEMKRLKLEKNREELENINHFQRSMHKDEDIGRLFAHVQTYWETPSLNNSHRTVDSLKQFPLTRTGFLEHPSYVTTTIRGFREHDRYVVVSASGEGVDAVLMLAKLFDLIWRENGWNPRRSIIFCLFSGSRNPCPEILSKLETYEVMAYIVIHPEAFQGIGSFIASGSDGVRSVVLESANNVIEWFPHGDLVALNNIFFDGTISRLPLNVPHAVLSFLKAPDNVTHYESDRARDSCKMLLARIIGETVWRLSESSYIKWNPKFSQIIVNEALHLVNSTELSEETTLAVQTVDQLTTRITDFKERVDAKCKSRLYVRMLNDFWINLDRILLCPDEQNRSRTDWSKFLTLAHESPNVTRAYVDEFVKCYAKAIEFLPSPLDE